MKLFKKFEFYLLDKYMVWRWRNNHPPGVKANQRYLELARYLQLTPLSRAEQRT